MLTNSERLSKKYLAVPVLTSALCLASCGTTKTTTTARGQYDRATACFSDSSGKETSTTQTRIEEQVDSLLQAALKQTSDHESEASVEQTLHLLLFDTTQPADTSTGLPPVKAALTKTTTAKHKETTKGTAQADVKSELTKQKKDSTQTVTESTEHLQSNQRTSESGKNSTTDKVETQRSSWSFWLTIILALLVAVIGCIIYLRRK